MEEIKNGAANPFSTQSVGRLILKFANKVSKLLGKTGISVINRIFGILLTALSCQFFIDGIIDIVKNLK